MNSRSDKLMADNSNHHVIIPAGYGRRMGNMTEDLPKSLLELEGRTIIGRDGITTGLKRRFAMNVEKVIFGFFIILALTLNFSFVVGDIDVPHHHNLYVFFVVIVVNLLAMGLKLGDRSQIGALLLATSLVAVLQLVSAAVVWTTAVHVAGVGLVPGVMESIVSLAAGALLANIVSVVMLVTDSLRSGR